MKFNKERFANFAKYDLAINRVFYRNLALVTLVGTIGIAMVGFSARYTLWNNLQIDGVMTNDPSMQGDPFSTDYNSMTMTASYILSFLIIMMMIFAGCWAHNLRNKQGRITELTLPATNWEKYLWHTGLMLVGGFAVCLLSLLVSDGLNALLTLIVYGSEGGVASLTGAIGDIFNLTFFKNAMLPQVTINGEVGIMDGPNETALALLNAIRFLMVSGCIAEVFIYLFGNAVKYKYNIIFTYIALQIIGAVCVILFFVALAVFANNVDHISMDPNAGETFIRDMTVGFYIIGSLALILTAVCGWKSYHLYTKAQITSSLNK